MPRPSRIGPDAGVAGPLVLGAEALGSQAVPSTTSRTVASGARSSVCGSDGHPQVAAVGDPAGVRLLGLGEQAQQGGLAGAVEADDADPVGVVEAERDVGEQLAGRAVALADTRSRLTMLAIGYSTRAPGDRARARCAPSRHTPAAVQRGRDLGGVRGVAGQEDAGRAGAGDEAGDAPRPARPPRASSASSGRSDRRGRLQVVAERRASTAGSRWRSAASRSSARAERRRRRARPRAAGRARGRPPGWTGRRRRSRPPSARWSGRARTGLTASPRPVPSAVPPCTRNGTSEPSVGGDRRPARRGTGRCPTARRRRPAWRPRRRCRRPARRPAGCCLRRCSRAWAGTRACAASARAARMTRLVSSRASSPAPSPSMVRVRVSPGRAVSSSKRRSRGRRCSARGSRPGAAGRRRDAD